MRKVYLDQLAIEHLHPLPGAFASTSVAAQLPRGSMPAPIMLLNGNSPFSRHSIIMVCITWSVVITGCRDDRVSCPKQF